MGVLGRDADDRRASADPDRRPGDDARRVLPAARHWDVQTDSSSWRSASAASARSASIGPRADFGYVTTTPKPGWHDVDVRGHFAERFDVPIGFDNDVNGAALAEARWGAAQGCAAPSTYDRDGIGGGVVVDAGRLHGLVHPEHGHIRVRGGRRRLRRCLPVPRRLHRGLGVRTGDRRPRRGTGADARREHPGVGRRGQRARGADGHSWCWPSRRSAS